jgi:hypothetical protein
MNQGCISWAIPLTGKSLFAPCTGMIVFPRIFVPICVQKSTIHRRYVPPLKNKKKPIRFLSAVRTSTEVLPGVADGPAGQFAESPGNTYKKGRETYT